MRKRLCAAVLLLGVAQATLHAQGYPARPVRLVTGGVGGNTDFVTRVLAQGLAGPLGQPVVVENRPTGVIPGDTVAKASPDGHTLLVAGSLMFLLPYLRENLPFDPVGDFAPIIMACLTINVVVVSPSLPAKSVDELIALARTRPGSLNYGSTGPGSSSHLGAELFKAMASVRIAHIPYRSGSTMMADLIGGQVQLAFATADSAIPYIRSGRLRALAVTGTKPSAVFPELPTVADSGLPGYESGTITGLLAPAKTPGALIDRVNRETARVLVQPEVKEKFLRAGVETAGGTPAQYAAAIESNMTRMGRLIRSAGIREE